VSSRTSQFSHGRPTYSPAGALMAVSGSGVIAGQSGPDGGPSSSGVSTEAPPEEEASPLSPELRSEPCSSTPSGVVEQHSDVGARDLATTTPSDDGWVFSDYDTGESLGGSDTPHASRYATPLAVSQTLQPLQRPPLSVETSVASYDSAVSDSVDVADSQSATVLPSSLPTSISLMVDTTELLLAKNRLEAEVFQLRSDSDGLHASIAGLTQQRDKLEQEAQILKAENATIADDGRELLQRKSTLSRDTAALARTKEESIQELLELDGKKARLVSTCENHSAEVSRLLQRRDTLSKELEPVQAALAARQREVNQADEKLKITRSDVIQAKQELAQLKSQVKTAREEANAEISALSSRVSPSCLRHFATDPQT
jgi:hypothetical protein